MATLTQTLSLKGNHWFLLILASYKGSEGRTSNDDDDDDDAHFFFVSPLFLACVAFFRNLVETPKSKVT
jgi:hypothetical protein